MTNQGNYPVDKLRVQAHGDPDYEAIHRGNADEPEGRLGRDVQLDCHTSSYPRIGDLSISRGIDQGAGKLDHFYIKNYYIQRLTGMTPNNSKEFQKKRRVQGNLMRVRSMLYNFREVFGRGCFLVMGDYK